MERSLGSATKHLHNHALQSAAKLSVCYRIHLEISRQGEISFPCFRAFLQSWMRTQPSSVQEGARASLLAQTLVRI